MHRMNSTSSPSRHRDTWAMEAAESIIVGRTRIEDLTRIEQGRVQANTAVYKRHPELSERIVSYWRNQQLARQYPDIYGCWFPAETKRRFGEKLYHEWFPARLYSEEGTPR